MTERLLDLQTIDTTTDQLRYRRAHLPEADAAASARAELATWERAVADLRARIDALEAEVEREEHAAKEIDTKRARLQQQLRTVIAPREAEALQHEIATLTAQRGELDDRELEALEAQTGADDELQALLADEPRLRAALATAAEQLAAAQALVDDELAALDASRTSLRAELDAAVLDRYDRLRTHLGGIAVAKLVGSRCDGCHLDMSAAELDTVRHAPPDELPECPNCSRLLVR
jgi:predicted  nucleic acid-binding Zn-ribbon protein